MTAARVTTDDPPSTRPSPRKKVHIRIEYSGEGPPGPALAQSCESLVRMLVEGDAGVIDERKTGNGAVDLYVITRFADHTANVARRSINELGLSDRSAIRVLRDEKRKR